MKRYLYPVLLFVSVLCGVFWLLSDVSRPSGSLWFSYGHDTSLSPEITADSYRKGMKSGSFGSSEDEGRLGGVFGGTLRSRTKRSSGVSGSEVLLGGSSVRSRFSGDRSLRRSRVSGSSFEGPRYASSGSLHGSSRRTVGGSSSLGLSGGGLGTTALSGHLRGAPSNRTLDLPPPEEIPSGGSTNLPPPEEENQTPDLPPPYEAPVPCGVVLLLLLAIGYGCRRRCGASAV